MAAEMRQCDRHIPTVVSATSPYGEAMVNALFGATAVIITLAVPPPSGQILVNVASVESAEYVLGGTETSAIRYVRRHSRKPPPSQGYRALWLH